MKITQVTPGIISIPPNGWGAIEKVVWNYKNALEHYGFECDIKYLDEIDVNNTDIVHIHVANLAIEAKKRGIPYIFSLHDHHVYRYGKNSDLYNENLEAIKGSIISFCHAEFLVDFFDDTDKLFYLSHGVDSSYFTPSKENKLKQDIKLLCVANNGYSDDNSSDRKGFRYAIEAAKELNLPITIVGPENNSNFFKKNKDLLKYDKLNIIAKNVTEDELLEIYRSHTIFLHPSELEAGHPNLTILEAISCSMPVVGIYDGSIELKAFVNAKRNTESVVNGINKVVLNYEDYLDRCKYDREKFDWA
jgi:glycosyltransferase involved in cell wall biosynthesis